MQGYARPPARSGRQERAWGRWGTVDSGEGVISFYALGWVFICVALTAAALAVIGMAHDVKMVFHLPTRAKPEHDHSEPTRRLASMPGGQASSTPSWSAQPIVEKSA